MNNLLFLYNNLMTQDTYKKLHLPFEFISYAIADGRLYHHNRKTSTFMLPLNTHKVFGNTKVYGALILCKDIDFYISLLDAYNACSMDKLKRNHIKDLHHREDIEVTPIYFNTLDDLSRLKYREGKNTMAITYLGNIDHPKINQRLGVKKQHRIIDGVDKRNYKKLFREVTINGY